MEFVEEELEKVIEEHSFGVNSIRVSEDAPSELRSRVTVRTLENNTFLVELIPTRGFRILNKDGVETEEEEIYESMQALLMQISPGYRDAFHASLCAKLQAKTGAQDE
ncbi:hypothetical protein QOT17_005320 [Balamuthia mandrillaris]